MITRKYILLSVTAVATLYLVQGNGCQASDNSQLSATVGAASVSASGLSLKVDLARQVDDSQNLRQKPVQKTMPEPVCRGHREIDKTLILGSDVVPM